MKVRITFYIDDECRRGIALYNDGWRKYDGKRKATREEIEGRIQDGAGMPLDDACSQYRNWLERRELEGKV